MKKRKPKVPDKIELVAQLAVIRAELAEIKDACRSVSKAVSLMEKGLAQVD